MLWTLSKTPSFKVRRGLSNPLIKSNCLYITELVDMYLLILAKIIGVQVLLKLLVHGCVRNCPDCVALEYRASKICVRSMRRGIW